MVIIYPVIELSDLIYAHRYGWLDALTRVTEGIMLRPETMLGHVFKSGKTIKEYLIQRYGLPQGSLDRLRIMLDHGINTPSFREIFGLDKTPGNLVEVYSSLGVDMGIAFDVPARLYLSVIVDMIVDGNTEVYVDESVKGIIGEVAEIIKEQFRNNSSDNSALNQGAMRKKVRGRAMFMIMNDPNVQDLLRKLSKVSIEETVKRLKEMVKYAQRLGFKGLVPVIQGLFKDDIEHCIKETIEVMTQYSGEFTIAIGTGGRVLSREDIEKIKFAITKIKEYATKNNVNAKVHLLGWSSPNRLWDAEVLRSVYSADSLTVRRRAVEGRVFVINGNLIDLVHVSRLKDTNCECPACSDPILRKYVLDPSGARRNDVRMVHNIYTITRLLDERYAI